MMITHYLKVAFRNLWKYKTQHLAGVPGESGRRNQAGVI